MLLHLKPILLYGSEIWGVRKYEDIEKIQVRYCKIQGVPIRMP